MENASRPHPHAHPGFRILRPLILAPHQFCRLRQPLPQPESGLPDMVAAISATNPAARLELRRNPVILVTILSDLLVRSLVIATNHAVATNRANDSNRAVADILASTLARTFNDYSDDDFRQAYARASDYAGSLAHVFSDTHKMASYHARDLDLARASDIARDHARDLERDLARASDIARDHARDLERDPDHPPHRPCPRPRSLHFLRLRHHA